MQFGEHKNGVFHPKRGTGVKEMHPAVGADPRVCPKKRTGAFVRLSGRRGRAFAAVRADDLPQPLRRRVAIGSAPTEEGGKGFVHTKRSYAPV